MGDFTSRLTAKGRRFRQLGYAIGILIFALGSAAQAADSCEPVVGRVASAEGNVEVQRGADASWTAAKLNQTLCEGDSVRAAERSRAAIALSNQAVLRVDQNSAVRLVNVSNKPEERSFVDLLRGAIQSFSRKPRRLEVSTPYLNGSIEGTEFVMRVTDKETILTVFEGTVRAGNPQGTVAVTSGQSVAAEAGKAPQPRTVVRPRDAAQWALYYPPVLAMTDSAAAPASLRNAQESAARGNYPAAFAALDGVPEGERDARFHLLRASLLLSVGRVDDARADIDRALVQDAGSGLSHALSAVIAVVLNDRDRALAEGRKAVELAPDSAAAYIALSYAQQARFDLPAARETLLTAVKRQPKDALAWARLSELHLMLGERRDSIAAAEKSLALAPGLGRAHMALGFAALANFQISAATDSFEKAIAADNADPLPHLGLGLARINRGKLEAGRGEIELAVGLDSNSALLRAYLGKAYFEERRADIDAQQFRIAKELDPRDPTAYLYDGIRLQTENRPAEAVEALEYSIARNDDRATYRSRLLLDQDRAARGTSLARGYDDLGFAQLGSNEAAKSLATDPGNASAHRFLADALRNDPRREIGRVSEELQAQLLQDININPVQPSSGETGLNVVTGGGPASAGFNEFTPLFQRDQAQAALSGFAGSMNTRGGEIAASALINRFSVSAGTYNYKTDGFRENNDNTHSVYNIFAQAELAAGFNVQVEQRHRESNNGDIVMRFDPMTYYDDFRQKREIDSTRVGARLNFGPRSTLLLSAISSDRTEEGGVTLLNVPGAIIYRTDFETKEKADQYELQYLFRADSFNLQAGASQAKSDVDTSQQDTLTTYVPVDIGPGPPFPPIIVMVPVTTVTPSQQSVELRDTRAYLYGYTRFPATVQWTLGVAYDKHEEDTYDYKVEQWSPKVGAQWGISDTLALRAAYFQTVKPALAGNRTLEPTQIAGFNQLFDDANGTKATRYGAALDWRATRTVSTGIEATWRAIEHPDIVSGSVQTQDWDEQLHRLYAYWTPSARWSLGVEGAYDDFASNNLDASRPRNVTTITAPVRVQYFHPSGWFAGYVMTYVDQAVENNNIPAGTGTTKLDSRFTVSDFALGYRLPQRRGIVSVTVQNLFDRQFSYQDNSYRAFQDVSITAPYKPVRSLMGRIMVNF
jgi:Tfp pilus assembly protein PilF